MKQHYYPKLAADAIRKNRRLYLPYILTGSLMVMMFYIMCFLSKSPTVREIPGGDTLSMILPMGIGVIGFFSFLFLFYSHSFLLRQRNRELGLYNILGMDKRNISRIMLWESLIVSGFAITFGLILGIALSKAAELALLNLVQAEVTDRVVLDGGAVLLTAAVYAGIYFLLYLSALVRVVRSGPLEMMREGKAGEKPPRANRVLALAGVLLLGCAYFLAVSIDEPLTALVVFFIAVLLVIAATYLLFVSGSVALCRALQKNKKYYYRKNHFISLSSMVYRMKRNGAGLASICILLTMVLVMISSTASLYFGSEDTLYQTYPHDIGVTVRADTAESFNEENTRVMRRLVAESGGVEPMQQRDFCSASISGLLTDSGLRYDMDEQEDLSLFSYEQIGSVEAIGLSDYNRLTGCEETLADDECLLFSYRTEYTAQTFALEGGKTYRVKKMLDGFFPEASASMMAIPTLFVVVNDWDAFAAQVPGRSAGGERLMQLMWSCGFDTEQDAAQQGDLCESIRSAFREHFEDGDIRSYYAQSREVHRIDYYATFGGLFFLGIMLSLVFLLAAVLIIYYKQISEGYEDSARFAIMRKVGMTEKDIHSSVNSQMLTVFYLPLLLAGLHLCFAFPMVWKLLQLFHLNNLVLVVGVSVACFLLFGAFYTLVYRITSNAYCSIVSGKKE